MMNTNTVNDAREIFEHIPHSADYWTSVEDVEADHIYELNNESVPGIDDTLWYAIVNKIVPNYGWSNEDITAVLP